MGSYLVKSLVQRSFVKSIVLLIQALVYFLLCIVFVRTGRVWPTFLSRSLIVLGTVKNVAPEMLMIEGLEIFSWKNSPFTDYQLFSTYATASASSVGIKANNAVSRAEHL